MLALRHRRLLDGVDHVLQLDEVEAAVAQLDLHRHARGIADALDRRRRHHQNARFLNFIHGPVEACEQRQQALVFAALVPVFEDDVGDAGIGERGAVVERRDAGDADDLAHALGALGDFLNAVHHLLGALERCAVGQLNAGEQIALVLDRQEAGRNAGEAVNRHSGDDQRNRDHDAAAVGHASDQPRIATFEPVIDRD